MLVGILWLPCLLWNAFEEAQGLHDLFGVQDLLIMYPILADHPAEVLTAFNRLLLHAQALQLHNPSILQQVKSMLSLSAQSPSKDHQNKRH